MLGFAAVLVWLLLYSLPSCLLPSSPRRWTTTMNIQTRYLAAPLFYLGLSTLLVVGSCSTKHLISIAVTPQNASVAQVGQTTQFTAMGTTNHVNVPPEDLTSTVTWTSSTPSVATITSSGLATATGCGTATISAQDGSITGNTSLTVSCTTGGSGTLQSINLSPTGPTIPMLGQTTQFIALGEYVTPSSTVDLHHHSHMVIEQRGHCLGYQFWSRNCNRLRINHNYGGISGSTRSDPTDGLVYAIESGLAIDKYLPRQSFHTTSRTNNSVHCIRRLYACFQR